MYFQLHNADVIEEDAFIQMHIVKGITSSIFICIQEYSIWILWILNITQ